MDEDKSLVYIDGIHRPQKRRFLRHKDQIQQLNDLF